jgi:hypothetical protein
MATPTCAPFTDDPLYANRAGSTDDEMLASVVEASMKEVRGDYDNTDKANAGRMARYLKNMMGMQMPGVDAFVDKVLGAIPSNDVLASTKRMQVIAASEVYWERRGAGIKQMAQNYLAQKKDGQLAAAQALEFLYQLKSFNSMARRIAAENLDAGSALRQKKIAKGVGDGMEFSGQLSTEVTRTPGMQQEILSKIGEDIDAFDDIARRINSGDLAGALQDVEKQAKQLSMMDDPREVAGLISRWKSTWNTWDEVWINGLLSSPATFVVNTVGAAWVVMRPMLQSGFAQAFAASGIGGAEWTKAANAAAAEAGAQLAAMQASFQDAAVLGWRAAKSEKSLLMGTDQKITAKTLRSQGALLDRLGPSEEIDRAINLVGQIVRLPSRGMLGMDEFAKTLALRGEVAANGVRRAVLDKVDLTDQKALKRYVEAEMEMAFDVNAGEMSKRYAFDPSSVDDVDGRALQYQLNNQSTTGTGRDVSMRARESVFQEDNRIAKGVSEKINNSGVFRPILKPFIPFVTTPTNILKQGLYESTGLDAVGKTFNIAKETGFNPVRTFNEIQRQLLNDPADSFRVGGQVAFMTLVGGTVYGMAMNGTITGGGPEQWATGYNARKAQQAWIAAGNIPYSIDVGNGVRIPLAKLGEPFATPLRMIADLGMYSGFMDRTEQDKSIAQIVGIMSAGVFEASFLQGLDNLMTIIRSGAEGNVDYELGRGVQNYFATQMPFGSLLAFADRVNNPYRAAYEGATFTEMVNFAEIEMGRGLFGKLVNKIPGVETQPMLIDQITGQPVPIVPGTGPQGLNPLLQAVPFFPRQSSADPVWDAIYAIQGSYTEKGLGEDIKATPEEQQAFNRLMSESRIDGKTVAQAITEFRRRPDVIEYLAKSGVTIKGTGIKKEFNALLTRYRNRARNLMLASSPNLAQRRNTAAAINYAKNNNDVEQIEALEGQLDELVQRAKKGY